MKRLLALLLLLLTTATAANATDWVSSFVVYNDSIYTTTTERVSEVGNKLGEVTSYSDIENLSGNFSNEFPVGTAYYAIQGADPADAIAVETVDGYVRATFASADYKPNGFVETLKDFVEPVDEPIEVIAGGGFMWFVVLLVIGVIVLIFFSKRGEK